MRKENRPNLFERLALQARRTSSKVRPVSQVTAIISCENLDQKFDDVRYEILKWASKRSGRPLQEAAWRGKSFELQGVGAQPVEATHLKEQGYYALILDDNDKEIPQRNWKTEAAIAKHESGILFGTRLFCVTRGKDTPFVSSVPGFIRQIAENHGATIDGRPVGRGPWIVNSKVKVKQLVALLVDRKREQEICVISTKNESEDPISTLVDSEKIFARTVGAVHVVVLTSKASHELTRMIGKEFSVFQQSVRTYRPGFNPDESEWHEHPLALAQKISVWDGGVSAFEDFLITQCLRRTVAEARMKSEQKLPSYALVKEIDRKTKREQRREAAKSDEEMLTLMDEENSDLRKQLQKENEENGQLLSEAEEERDQAIAELNEAKNRIMSLEHRMLYLESIQKKSKVPIPNTFGDLEKWSQNHLAGKVFIHNRAIRAAQKVEEACGPDNIRLAYEALLTLRDCYVPMRREGGQKYKKKYQQQLQDKGLEETSAFAGARAGQYGDTYFIEFRGRRIEMDRHLKKGTGRTPRTCFRLYFFWDSDTKQVVVGSFPAHLKNKAT